MAKQTTPLQNLEYVETVLKDVQGVLKKMHEDKDGVSFEQRGKLSGCLDEIWHALSAIQDDDVGLKGKLERFMGIEAKVEPPTTRIWTRYRGTLLQCLVKAADTYYDTTPEDQDGDDWRVLVPRLEIGRIDRNVYTPQQLLEQVAQRPEQAALPAILDYDVSWSGESISRGEQTEPLWVHAKLYIVGNNEPVALIYWIDW